MEVTVTVTEPTPAQQPVWEPDFPDLDDTELAALAARVEREVTRRRTLSRARETAQQANRDYLLAAGRAPGGAWAPPTSAIDAYPSGWTVTHGGKTWESLTASNVHEPGVSGWRQVPTDEAPVPQWVQPTGAHDTYQAGDTVTFEGQVWRSRLDGNAWSPAEYPAGWEMVDDVG